jgi:hypothetical protein
MESAGLGTDSIAREEMEMDSAKLERRLIHADAVSLLSLGLQLTYILGLFTSSLGNRGWPGWLRAYLPRWLSPFDVLLALPSVGLFTCGVSLLMAEREVSDRSVTDTERMPWLCWASLVGIVGLILFNAVTLRVFFLNQSMPFAVVAFAPITAFFLRRLMRRDRRRETSLPG